MTALPPPKSTIKDEFEPMSSNPKSSIKPAADPSKKRGTRSPRSDGAQDVARDESAQERAAGERDEAPAGGLIPEDERRSLIAREAYLRAEKRRFEPGRDVDDWLAAEAEISSRLRKGPNEKA
jgi:hypothetical protein